MDVFLWILVGAVAGLATSALLPGRPAEGGAMMDLIVGVVGTVFVGWMAQTYAIGHTVTGYLLVSSAVALAGAALFLLVFRGMASRSGPHSYD